MSVELDIQRIGGDAISLTIRRNGKRSYWTMIPTEDFIHTFKLHEKRVTGSHKKIKQEARY